jgi:hypothetical protein
MRRSLPALAFGLTPWPERTLVGGVAGGESCRIDALSSPTRASGLRSVDCVVQREELAMRSTLLITCLTAVAALVLAGGAAAEVADEAQSAPEEVEVYVQDVDRRGNALGPRVQLSAEEAAARRQAGSDVRTGRRLAATASSGCRAVDVARVGRSLLGFVVYKFWQRKNWCWSYPKVTSASSSAWVTDVDPNWYYGGVVSAWGEFYNWCCGVWNSGHRSFRQGAFQNCVLKYGCIKSEYPWVLIRGHGDGGFTYDTGT